jgi:hypothetical protein
MNQLATKPALAVKIAAVVIEPRILIARPFTLSPMIVRLLVINMMSSNSGGVENPCTTPAQTSAFIGLKPRKFIATPITVKPMMEA